MIYARVQRSPPFFPYPAANDNWFRAFTVISSAVKYSHDNAYDELSRLIESIGAAAQTSLFEKGIRGTQYLTTKSGDSEIQ